VKTRIRPGIAVIIVVAVLGALFGIMWFQSEAPKLNRLPRPMAMGPSAAPTAPPQKRLPQKAAEPSAAAADSHSK